MRSLRWPPLSYDSSRSSALVRSYSARGLACRQCSAGSGEPASTDYRQRGALGLTSFRTVIADDLWLDHRFAPHEIEIVDCAPVAVMVPRRAPDLLRVLRRANRGKDRASLPDGARERIRTTTHATLADLRRLAASGPIKALDAATYAGFATGARLLCALGPTSAARAAGGWERDNSSRQ